MPRGAGACVAAFALTAALACDNGGFDAATWNLALVAVCTLALVVIVLGGACAPGRGATVYVAALAALTVWTALSYFWSDSPPLAPVEAQRVALYFAVALTAVLARAWTEPRFIAGGVAAAATFVAMWNLVVRIRGAANPEDTGALAAPVGYANSLALLCAVGCVLLLALPRPALVALPVLLADLLLQHSEGSIVALAIAVASYGVMKRPRARPLLAAVVIACIVIAPFALRGNERPHYWRVAAREATAHRLMGSGSGTFADWWLRARPTPVSTREAHSLYLETLAELGPLGLALVLTVLAVPVAGAVRSREAVLGAAVLAYAVGATADFHWELAGVTVPAVLLGATVFAHEPPRRLRPAALVPLLVALVVAGVLAYAGNVRLASAQSALRTGDSTRAADDARTALHFAPYSAAAWEAIGDADHDAAAYRRGVELDPNAWSLWAKLAAVTSGEPRRLALREAARLNPLASGR